MNAAIDAREWWTRRVTDGQPCEKKDAAILLRKIAEGTHLCGDPGVQFDTTIDLWHTCKGTGRQNSTNPCSEYLFLDKHRLQSRLAQPPQVQEGGRSVSTSSGSRPPCASSSPPRKSSSTTPAIPIKSIAENSHIFRTLGLGFANLGALIMSYGLGYDTDEGRALAGAITSIMTGHAYEQSPGWRNPWAHFPATRTRAPAA